MVNFLVYIFIAIVLIGIFVFGYAIRHSVQVSEDTPFLYGDCEYDDIHGDKEEEKVEVVEEKPKKRGRKKKVQKKD